MGGLNHDKDYSEKPEIKSEIWSNSWKFINIINNEPIH